MEIEGRTYVNVNAYRYGFNGKEKDAEGMGGGGSTCDYGFRIYNPALGKFLSVDPLTKSYPWYTPYQFAGNKPINCIDLDGLEELEVHSADITGKIDDMVKMHKSQAEIEDYVNKAMDIHAYDTPKSEKWATKHYGYNGDGQIVEVTNQSAPLTIWGYRANYAVNAEGKIYIQSYERYKVYEAAKKQLPTKTNPSTPDKASTNSSVFDDIDNYMRHAGPNLYGQHGYDHGGKQLLGGTIAVVTAPFAIAGGGIGAFLGYVGLGNGLDDMGTNSNGESLTQQLATNPDTKATIGNIKLWATLTTAGAGGVSGVATFSSSKITVATKAANAVSTVNDIVSATQTIIDKTK